MIPSITTDEQLCECCAKWQRILRLQDWTVKISFRRHFEMPPRRQGTNRFNLSKKHACAGVLTPSDFDASDGELDVEKVVVHELLHLHTAMFTEDDPKGLLLVGEEQAVDAIAGALIKLHRRDTA